MNIEKDVVNGVILLTETCDGINNEMNSILHISNTDNKNIHRENDVERGLFEISNVKKYQMNSIADIANVDDHNKLNTEKDDISNTNKNKNRKTVELCEGINSIYSMHGIYNEMNTIADISNT
eukprot:Pgem_evm2s11993